MRGGYGSARLFDGVRRMKPEGASKIFIGYSDSTFLHLLFNQWGWKTIHGAMPVDLLRGASGGATVDPNNFLLLQNMLASLKNKVIYCGLKPLNPQAVNLGSVSGKLIGGNLTLLTNSLGTAWQIKGQDQIIFIEDCGVKGYAVDRDLTHLKHAGVFTNARAVLFGTFERGDDCIPHAIKKFAETLGIPVFSSNLFGHGKSNYPLPFGFESVIKRGGRDMFEINIEYDFTN